MNDFLKVALALGLATVLGLSSCTQQDEDPAEGSTSGEAADPAGQSSAAESQPVLGSGIDFSGFDTSIRPQDDLFAYVNGKWVEQTDIPADRARWGSFDMLRENSQKDVRALVEKVSAADDVEPGSPAQKIRDFYNAYVDPDRPNELGAAPVQAELAEIAAAQSYDDVYRLFSTLGVYGVNSPIGTAIFSDRKDPNTNVVYLAQAGITLPDRDYYLKDDEQFVKGRELYQTYVARLFELAGIEGGQDKAKSLYELEHALAEVQWPKEDNRDPVKVYNPHTLQQLAELGPDINWQVILDTAQLGSRDLYIVQQPSFFKATNDIMVNTPLDTWKDYLAFQTLNTFAPVLGDAFFQAWFEFNQKGLQGIEEPQEKWKRAVTAINGNMGELLGQLYVDEHYRESAKARMETMIDNLKEAYRQSILELDWMGEDTRQQALLKLSKFDPKIGYPDEWRDYSTMEIVPDDLAGNIKSAARFEYQRNINKLDRPVDKSEWFMNPQDVNAYYNPAWNEIVFPAAILQPPFFNVLADDAVNYGGIGAVIGHEIGHGFDDQGRKFDGDGNLRDWWTEEDNNRFLELKNKLAAQYDSYDVIDGMTINGQFTSGENIGDLGGLGIAYKAYRLSLKGQEAPVIDGFTGDQRFFLGWAQVWRSKARDEETRRLLTIDPHSPPRFRANGAAVNVTEFYEAFDVREGDGMYLPPADRVKIW